MYAKHRYALFFGIRIVNLHCIQQNVHILITQIFLQIGKIPNNNKVTAILKLARLKEAFKEHSWHIEGTLKEQ